MRTTLAGLALLALTGNTLAANTGELWEVSSTMNVPGMPAGMGGRTSRVCTDKNESPAGGRKDCKVSNVKRSGLTESMTMTCPDATMNVEMTYNAARTEYKGKMTMKSRDGDMEMNTSGRKVGACDPGAEQPQLTEVKKHFAQSHKTLIAENEKTAKECTVGAQTLDLHKFTRFQMCEKDPKYCQDLNAEALKMDRDAGTKQMLSSCRVQMNEYCKRFQTMDGFSKVSSTGQGNANQGASACNTSVTQIKASLCPSALKTENFGFLDGYCPAETKTLWSAHCPGRNFSDESKNDKYSDFCRRHRPNKDLDEADRKQGSSQQRASAPATKDEEKKGSNKNTVTDGVNQGINKLRSLFGR